MLDGTPARVYCFAGENTQTPIAIPSSAATVPRPEAQITNWVHCSAWRRNGVKYSQCGIAPKYAPARDARVVYCATSPVTVETYTSSPSGHENFRIGRKARNC